MWLVSWKSLCTQYIMIHEGDPIISILQKKEIAPSMEWGSAHHGSSCHDRLPQAYYLASAVYAMTVQ